MIEQRLTEPDAFELIRDQVALVLKSELESQAAKAEGDSEDPAPYDLRVFVERTRPWEALREDDLRPIVNIWFDRQGDNRSKGTPTRRMHVTSSYNVDCYGFAKNAETAEGHASGDEGAALEAQRASRLCRQIIMHATYESLGFPLQSQIEDSSRQLVLGRRVVSREAFQPTIGAHSVEDVSAVRLALEVDHNEWAGQAVPKPLNILTVDIVRADDGEVTLASLTAFDVTP